MADIRAVVMDIDDTLVERGKLIAAQDIQTIRQLVNHQLHVAIISGRPTPSTEKLLIQSGLPKELVQSSIIVIGYNGSYGHLGGRSLLCRTIERRIGKAILDKARTLNATAAFFSATRFFCSRRDRWIENYEDKLDYGEAELQSREDFKEEIFKFVILQDPQDIEAIRKMDEFVGVESSSGTGDIVALRLGNQFTHTDSPCAWLEVMPKGVHKGFAVSCLAKKLELRLDEIMCIGDGINDREMLEIPEVLSVVMGNSRYESIKALADYISHRIDDETPGVTHAINRYIFNRRQP